MTRVYRTQLLVKSCTGYGNPYQRNKSLTKLSSRQGGNRIRLVCRYVMNVVIARLFTIVREILNVFSPCYGPEYCVDVEHIL